MVCTSSHTVDERESDKMIEGKNSGAVITETKETSSYLFTETQDWFSAHIEAWRVLFPLVASPAPRVLEIGSWEGRSTVFLLTELCAKGGSVVCIDHFDLMNTAAGRERYAKLIHNLAATGKPHRIIDDYSVPALMMLLQEEIASEGHGFDWIYVDGSHEADDTFLDGELAWRLADKGAVFIFDDYRWNQEPEDSIHHPKRGIDSFMNLHTGEFDILSSPTQYQMVLRKKVHRRIGFLTKETSGLATTTTKYGMHVALAIDGSYTVPAAVTLQSIISHTAERITFHIVDLGLSASDREKLQRLLLKHENITLNFLRLPRGSLAAEMGPLWAKIAMVDVLPVERVLYLDADTLIRADLRLLWDIDLEGKAIGACVDVGHPKGHEGVERRSYFNAGVLLMDLTKLRQSYAELLGAVSAYSASPYKDQDALNAHLHSDWFELPLKWNAQGLGTYANHPHKDRKDLDMGQMEEPAIVHFTGPVHPSMEDVLNRWVQPYTAKPWGYAGSPGHPFEAEWWAILEQTTWRGWRSTGEYRKQYTTNSEMVLKAGIEAFRARFPITA